MRFLKRLIRYLRGFFRKKPAQPTPLTLKKLQTLLTKHDAWDSVERAWYAYHAPHPFSTDKRVHFFPHDGRTAACMRCGRTREQVRWDSLPPECQAAPFYPASLHDVQEVIRNEEERFLKMMEQMDSGMQKAWDKFGDTKRIHETYGWPEEEQLAWLAGNNMSRSRSAMEKE